MKKFFVSALLLTSITGSAEPLADSVAMTVGSKPISMAEFLYMAQKNGANNNLSEEKNLKDFVELFQNFKLKVIEAEAEGLDKAPSYKSELERYRSELISGYLSDKKAEDLVVEKEHERLKEFLGFDHLIFFLPAKCVSKDSRLSLGIILLSCLASRACLQWKRWRIAGVERCLKGNGTLRFIKALMIT